MKIIGLIDTPSTSLLTNPTNMLLFFVHLGLLSILFKLHGPAIQKVDSATIVIFSKIVHLPCYFEFDIWGRLFEARLA